MDNEEKEIYCEIDFMHATEETYGEIKEGDRI